MEYGRRIYINIYRNITLYCWFAWCVCVCARVYISDWNNLHGIPFLFVGYVCKADSQICSRINMFTEGFSSFLFFLHTSLFVWCGWAGCRDTVGDFKFQILIFDNILSVRFTIMVIIRCQRVETHIKQIRIQFKTDARLFVWGHTIFHNITAPFYLY